MELYRQLLVDASITLDMVRGHFGLAQLGEAIKFVGLLREACTDPVAFMAAAEGEPNQEDLPPTPPPPPGLPPFEEDDEAATQGAAGQLPPTPPPPAGMPPPEEEEHVLGAAGVGG